MSSERIHGGAAARGLDAGRVLDLSVNLNPYGPHPAVVEAIRAAPIDRYPDPRAMAAREAIARACGVSARRVAVGNGAAELLWSLARIFAGHGRAAAICEPAFSEFRAAVAGRVVEVRTHARQGFAFDVATVARAAREVDVLYLCAPGNPSGVPFSAHAIAEVASAAPGCTVVADESFLSLSDRFADANVALPPNVVRVRSLTKDHAIPGVRIGYVLASPDLVARIEHQRAAWTVSAGAQAAAIAAAALGSFVDASRERLRADRDALAAGLGALGYTPVASSAPYMLVPVDDAAGLCRELLERHAILLRDCASFGLPAWVRIAVRPRAERQRLFAALAG